MPMETKKWKKTVDRLTTLLEELISSDLRAFADFVSIVNERIKIWGISKSPGVYIIFEGEKPVYVGSSGKGNANLRTRFHDLFYYNKSRYPDKKDPSEPFNHTLTYRLTDPNRIGRFRHPDETREFYLTKCSFKVVETKTVQEARALESILILQLQTKYND